MWQGWRTFTVLRVVPRSGFPEVPFQVITDWLTFAGHWTVYRHHIALYRKPCNMGVKLGCALVYTTVYRILVYNSNLR